MHAPITPRPRSVLPHKKLSNDIGNSELPVGRPANLHPNNFHQILRNTIMLAARRLQNGCPSCKAQILKLCVHSIAEIAPAPAAAAAASRSTRHLTSRTRLSGRRHDARFLSTSSRRLEEKKTEEKTENPGIQQLPEDLTLSSAEAAARETHPEPILDELAQSPEKELVEEIPKELEEDIDEEQLAELPENQDPETMVRQAKRIFGDTLPLDYLSPDEYKLYERLYGEPLRPTAPEDVGFGSLGEAEEEEESRNATKHPLFREDEHGNLEEVVYTLQQHPSAAQIIDEDREAALSKEEAVMEVRPPSDMQLDYIEANVNNQREYDAMLRLQRDFEAARIAATRQVAKEKRRLAAEEKLAEEDEFDEEEDLEEDMEPDAQLDSILDNGGPRLHEYTVEGRFRTSPTTLSLPMANFVQPIAELLKRTDLKHIRSAAENRCGGRGLPHSPATPSFAKSKSMPQKGLGIEAGHTRMTEIDADAFISTAMPGIYACVTSALVEVRKRLGPDWMRGLLSRKDGDDDAGPRVLDAGAGGAGLSAWQNVVQAEWDLLREKDEELAAEPPGRKTVIVGSYQLRQRISQFLENTQFLPRLPNYASVDNSEKQLDAPEVPQKRKTYDVIIATHLLVPLDKEWRREDTLDNLWSMLSPNGGVLIVLEKGHPRGFEAVAEVRQRLLDEFILAPTMEPRQDPTNPDTEVRIREPGMIVAPCTNHNKCPMYLTPGLSPGRKDFCHFSQRFSRPQFLQGILGSTKRNHEDINFSFIAVRRGMPVPEATPEATIDTADDLPTPSATSDPDILTPRSLLQGEIATIASFGGYESTPSTSSQRPNPLSLPRIILPPLKRKGHVTLDLCTPSGSIERWTVPKSFSRQAYHDARKSRWGDLWALGAKTRVRSNVRLGRGVKEGERVPDDAGVRAARAAALNGYVDSKGRKRGKAKPRVVELGMSETGAFQERVRGVQHRRPERRTKGGRKPPSERNRLKLEEED